MRYLEAGFDDLSFMLDSQPELLIILGGPIGVYDKDDYPFLNVEIDILKNRINNQLPTIGICLGAQLIANAMGAKVFNGGRKEIGWSGLMINKNEDSDYFQYLDGLTTPVLHWHGDTFDLPDGAVLCASSDTYANQAFTHGKNILALQFHPEVTARGMERWFIGHAIEINVNNISISSLRADTNKYAATLELQAKKFFQGWLNNLA